MRITVVSLFGLTFGFLLGLKVSCLWPNSDRPAPSTSLPRNQYRDTLPEEQFSPGPGVEGSFGAQKSPQGTGFEERNEHVARQLYLLESMKIDGTAGPGDYERQMTLYGELNSDTAAMFAATYLKGVARGECDIAALKLACLSGGKPVTDLMELRLFDPRATSEEKSRIKRAIGGVLMDCYEVSSMPLSEELKRFSHSRCNSNDRDDRIASAGLLGLSSENESKQLLYRMVENDVDPIVRGAAGRALARLGGEEELKVLRRLLARIGPLENSDLEKQSFAKTMSESVARLEWRLARARYQSKAGTGK